ncbi:hypothetical protein LTR95_013162 [Oleoguttula sp. CCFEE 5521]
MGWVDAIPRAPGLHIGGLWALYQPQLMAAANITHVLSVIDFSLYTLNGSEDFLKAQKYTHSMIHIEDDPNENLLQHFEAMTELIDRGLREGTGVFVHCAMGKSRSAAAAMAYLMWKEGVSKEVALGWVCEGRPVCGPNPGFMEQLDVWGKMLAIEAGPERRKVYDAWEKGRFRGMAHEWEAREMKARL